MPSSNTNFGGIRSIIWPVYNHELKKTVLMILMFSLLVFDYIVLKDTKDALVITAAGGGTELIPFLKLWGVFPIAILLMILYIKLSNKLSKTSLFYVSLSPFIIFFALFVLVLYPARDYIHPNQFCDKLIDTLPVGLHGLVGALRNWTFSLFYIVSELWGSIALCMLGWGVANDITKFSESKRLYPLINLLTNLAIVVAGFFTEWAASLKSAIGINQDPWQLSLNYTMTAVCLSGVAIMIIYSQLMKNFSSVDASKCNPKINKSKKKQTLKTSLNHLLKSKYLGCIAVIVVAYGFCINFIEVIWKGQIKLQYPDPNTYSAFMGKMSQHTGIFSFVMLLFLGNRILNKFSWKINALITPVIMLVTGVGFFITLIFNNELTGITSYLGTTPLMLSIIFGGGQNIMAKSCKYSFFDTTKEMAFIPLSEEEKVKGKASIDVLASRLGKSGASFVQQFIILYFGSLVSVAPLIATILLAIILVWMFSIKVLNNKFKYLVKQHAQPNEKTESKPVYTKKSSKDYAYPDKTSSVKL